MNPGASGGEGRALRLLCVVSGDERHPSSRFRVLQHLPALRESGFDVRLHVAKHARLVDQARLAAEARRADVVLLQKKVMAPWRLRLLLGRAPVVFDLDDAIFTASPLEVGRYGLEAAGRRAARRGRRLGQVLRRCRRVIVGNGYLAEFAGRFCADVVVLPTAVDARAFADDALTAARAARRARDTVRLGWIGSRPSLAYLAALAEPLRAVCARFPHARLVQICDGFVDLPGVRTEERVWSAAGETADLLGLDVGLMPLEDTPFARGKCGLKILQYQAAALPVVCSPVGANRDIVADGVDGFFASDAAQWVERLGRLVQDAGLREAMGERGRRSLLEKHDASRLGPRLAEIVRGAAAERRTARGARKATAASGT